MKRRFWQLVALINVLGFSIIDVARAQVQIDQQFARALELLPEDARAGAKLVIRTPENGFSVHREGTNGFVCESDPPGDQRFALFCYHTSLETFLTRQRELSAEGLRGDEMYSVLCHEVREGLVPLPDGAYSVDAAASVPHELAIPDSLHVYHFLQLPFATQESTGMTEKELVKDAPWLHKGGTCDAHVMWSEMVSFAPGGTGR